MEFWLRAIATGSPSLNISETIYHWRKYLGTNSRTVSPRAWAKLARQYRFLYQQHGLEQRALTLMLLGDKWEGRATDATAELWQHCQKHGFSLGAIAALLLPPWLLRQSVGNWKR